MSVSICLVDVWDFFQHYAKAQKINVRVQVGSQSDASIRNKVVEFAIFKTSRTVEKSGFHRAFLSFLISFTEGEKKMSASNVKVNIAINKCRVWEERGEIIIIIEEKKKSAF